MVEFTSEAHLSLEFSYWVVFYSEFNFLNNVGWFKLSVCSCVKFVPLCLQRTGLISLNLSNLWTEICNICRICIDLHHLIPDNGKCLSINLEFYQFCESFQRTIFFGFIHFLYCFVFYFINWWFLYWFLSSCFGFILPFIF